MPDPLVVVGIDLGTYATGFAWAVIDEQNDDPQQRHIHFFTQWPGQPVSAVKNLSALLLGEDDKVLAWGYEARRRALNNVGGSEGPRYKAAFKMQLMERSRPREKTQRNPGHGDTAEWSRTTETDEPVEGATLGEEPAGAMNARTEDDREDAEGDDEDQSRLALLEPPTEAERLTTELLSRVRAVALGQITASGYLEEDVRFGITVPAIFTDETKQTIRRCAVAAGFSTEDSRLILALEPEAAVHNARVSGAKPPGDDDQPPTDLAAPGRRILVVDSGGGTVDLAAYKNDTDGRMVEIGIVNGGPHGSNELNRRFEDRLLADRFGKPELVAQLRDEVPEALLDLTEAWERQKLSFGPETVDPIALPIPTAIDRKLGASVRKRLARKQRGVTDTILISPQEMQDVFDTVVPDILDLIDEQLAEVISQSPPDSPKPVVLMVGGFSNSPYLQQALKQHVADRAHVLVPPDPSAAVLYGAVHFAYRPQTRARRARFTYGVAYSPSFEPGADPEKLRFVTSDGTARCANRFSKLVTVGDVVDTDEEISHGYLPIEGDTTGMAFHLYTSTEKDPRYVTDPGCLQIGSVHVDLTRVMRHALQDRAVRLYLGFGETEIKVRAVVVKSGEEVTASVHFASDY